MTYAALVLVAWLALPGADLPEIRRALAACDGATDHIRIASLLDQLRSLGPRAAGAGDIVSAMLDHRHPIYAERDKSVVIRLRTRLFLTLSEIGTPDSALIPLIDELAYFDVRMNPAEAGAAVRAAGALTTRGRRFAEYLLAMLDEPMAAQEFSLTRYEPTFDRRDATTLQIEVIRSLARIAAPSDAEVLRRLRTLIAADAQPGADHRVAAEARAAIVKIEGVRR
jgi:hypothetical protein